MSGIFGIFNRNGKPIEKEIANAMLEAFSYWSPDAKDIWIDGSITLGHTMLWNTPESKHEHLPLRDDIYVLTMDARIDNRDELAKEIELPDKALNKLGDSEFILGAYKKWGEACPKYLLGDFAFAIWDAKNKQIFCARDHVGVKQFYYHLSDDLFLFGNDLKGLTQYPDISKNINDKAVANYIVNQQLLSKTMTFFETFKKLPPAHSLTISNTKSRETCYWRLEDAPKVKLPDAEAYVETLRNLLEEAVYCRMRSCYPITSHLSGGFDSSAIAVLAARKLKEKNEKLLAFNWVPKPEAGDNPQVQEWANSKLIAETEDIDHHYVTLTTEDVCKNLSNRDIVYGETTPFWYEYPVREATQQHGSRTILSGWGGDEFASYRGHSFYVDLFVHGKFIKLYKELRSVAKKRKTMRSMLGFIYHTIVIPLVPKSLYCKMPKSLCDQDSFPFIKEDFIKTVMKENKKPRTLSMQVPKSIKAHMLAFWDNGYIQSRIETWSHASIINKLEYSYPLLDKRILELIVTLPREYVMKDTRGRYIFTLAVKDLLSKDILSVEKIPEQNRINRILSMIYEALKTLTTEDKITEEVNYIDLHNISDHLNQITPNTNRKNIREIAYLESTLSIYFSNTLNKKKKR